MPGPIPDEGSRAAKLVLVGEAPGQHEERLRRPFVGPSGYKLEEWWGRFGLARGDFYITNVWPEKPAGNRIESVPVRELEGAVDDLHARLAQLTDPWLVVPTGNTALRALMRRPLRGKETPKITDWRGSVLEYRDNRGRALKVIPTLHPAFVLREPGAERACLHDWQRIAKDRSFRDLRLPARDHAIEPTFDDLIEFRDSVLHDQEAPLAFDIETTQQRGNQILCVGFALSKIHSFTVPTTDAYWLGKAELSDVWEMLAEILHARNPKITQNGNYDYYWLGQCEEIRPVRWHWDTLAMHHALDCTDAHDLGYLACVTGDTEVLTPKGWKAIEHLESDESIAEWWPNYEISWSPVRHVHTYKYKGEMIHFDGPQSVDLLCTPNHRQPVLAGRDRGIKTERADEAVRRTRLELPLSGVKIENGPRYEAIRLCAAIQADGYVSGRRVRFCLKKTRKIRRLYELALILRVPIKEGAFNKKRGARTFILSGPVVEEIIGRLGKPKRWGSWLLQLNAANLMELIEECAEWDGHRQRDSRAYTYCSVVPGNCDWIATIAHLVGWRAYKYKDGVRVGIRPSMIGAISPKDKRRDRFAGRVWCPSVRSGFFLARRNGRIFVTGNSFDTRQPFWKRTTKDAEQRASYANDEHALWTYNGIDCCVTYELWAKYLKRLEQRGLLDFYVKHYRELQRPALKMARHGIRVDDRRRRWWHFNLQAERIEIQDRLAVLAGAPLHAAKSLSTTKLKAFLYNRESGLGLPVQRDRKTKSETTGEVAIRKLMQWTHTAGARSYKRLHLEQVREILQLILEERRKDKLVGFLSPDKIDPDGKLRASFKLTTETGRFASSSNPMRTGLNLQNQDREIRHTFIPDRDDHVFLECDLSQVEGRIVYVRSKDPKLIALAQTHPSAFDMHTYNAQLIFGVEQPTKEQRYLGKKVTHGAQRGLGGDKLSGELLKDGYVKSPLECGRYIQQYLTEHPGLQRYFATVRQTLLRDRQLVNLFGRVWNVEYERFGEDLYRRGYSWWPQSENGDLMNQQGFKPCSKWLAQEKLDAAINVQMHDSLLISCRPENVHDIAAFLKENLERPLDYGYCKLSIPVEFKLGRTWKGDVEFKTLPGRAEFTEAALDLLRQT